MLVPLLSDNYIFSQCFRNMVYRSKQRENIYSKFNITKASYIIKKKEQLSNQKRLMEQRQLRAHRILEDERKKAREEILMRLQDDIPKDADFSINLFRSFRTLRKTWKRNDRRRRQRLRKQERLSSAIERIVRSNGGSCLAQFRRLTGINAPPLPPPATEPQPLPTTSTEHSEDTEVVSNPTPELLFEDMEIVETTMYDEVGYLESHLQDAAVDFGAGDNPNTAGAAYQYAGPSYQYAAPAYPYATSAYPYNAADFSYATSAYPYNAADFSYAAGVYSYGAGAYPYATSAYQYGAASYPYADATYPYTSAFYPYAGDTYPYVATAYPYATYGYPVQDNVNYFPGEYVPQS